MAKTPRTAAQCDGREVSCEGGELAFGGYNAGACSLDAKRIAVIAAYPGSRASEIFARPPNRIWRRNEYTRRIRKRDEPRGTLARHA